MAGPAGRPGRRGGVADRHAQPPRQHGELYVHIPGPRALGRGFGGVAEQVVQQAGQVHGGQGTVPRQGAPDGQRQAGLPAAAVGFGQGHIGHRIVRVAADGAVFLPGELLHQLQRRPGLAGAQHLPQLPQPAVVLRPQLPQGFVVGLLGLQIAVLHRLIRGGDLQVLPAAAVQQEQEDRRHHSGFRQHRGEDQPDDPHPVGFGDQHDALDEIVQQVGQRGRQSQYRIGRAGQLFHLLGQQPRQHQRQRAGQEHDQKNGDAQKQALDLGPRPVQIVHQQQTGGDQGALEATVRKNAEQIAAPVPRKAEKDGQRHDGGHERGLDAGQPAVGIVEEPVQVEDRLGGHHQQAGEGVARLPFPAAAQRQQEPDHIVDQHIRRDQRQALHHSQAQIVLQGHGSGTSRSETALCSAATYRRKLCRTPAA